MKSRKERQEGKKRRFRLTPERKKQLIAIFIILLMMGSAFVLLFSY